MDELEIARLQKSQYETLLFTIVQDRLIAGLIDDIVQGTLMNSSP